MVYILKFLNLRGGGGGGRMKGTNYGKRSGDYAKITKQPWW